MLWVSLHTAAPPTNENEARFGGYKRKPFSGGLPLRWPSCMSGNERISHLAFRDEEESIVWWETCNPWENGVRVKAGVTFVLTGIFSPARKTTNDAG